MSFSINNCRVRVSFYFFAFLCIAAFFERSGFMFWGILAALLHECGHLAAMLFLPGHAPRELAVTPFGMKIEKSPLAEFRRGNAFILSAGSAMNFVCSAVTFGFLPEFASVSLVLGTLNLLPVDGMDGGGILIRMLRKFTDGRTAERVANRISWLTLCVMGTSGIYIILVTRSNFTLLGVTAALAIRSFTRQPKA